MIVEREAIESRLNEHSGMFVALQPFAKLVAIRPEARNSGGELLSRWGLREAIRDHADRPGALLHAAILQSVEQFTESGEQDDDLTLVVLEYRPDRL